MKRLQAKVTIKKDDNKITVIASDETLDRHGEVLPIDQWDLTKFNTAPRMLVDHNHQVEKIVGKWVNPRIENRQLMFDAVFHDFTPLAIAVKQMVMEGYLNTVSVGFIPHGPQKDGGKDTFELIETSWVTVPANPSATVVNRMKALENEPITVEQEAKIKEWAQKEDIEDDIPAEDPEDPVTPPTEEEIEEEEMTPISSVEDFKEWRKEKMVEDRVLCSVEFIEQLIESSEQLKTLTLNKKVEIAKQEKIMRLALKQAAGAISHLLREANKNSH